MVFIRTVVTANLALVTVGLSFGWSSSSLPKLLSEESVIIITDAQGAWLVSIIPLGGIIGLLFASCTLNFLGRRTVLLLAAIPHILGWLTLGLATTPHAMLIGRMLTGVGNGCSFSITPLYFSEIAPAKKRGATGISSMFALKFGMLISFILGIFVTVKTLSLFSMVVPIIFGVLFLWAPETPHYLMLRGNYDKARKSLERLRGTVEVDEEMEMIENLIDVDRKTNTSILDVFRVYTNRRAFFIMLGLTTAQYFSGNQPIFSFGQMIFDSTDAPVDGKYLMVIMGAVQIFASCITLSLIDSIGRRMLLMISASGCCVCTLVLTVYFYLQQIGQESTIGWLAATALIIFAISFSLGLISVPNMMIGELFPTSVRPKVGGFFGIYSDASAFLIIMMYDLLSSYVGTYMPFLIFCVFDLLACLHIYFFVPETKRKTLEEVQKMLASNMKHSSPDKIVFANNPTTSM